MKRLLILFTISTLAFADLPKIQTFHVPQYAIFQRRQQGNMNITNHQQRMRLELDRIVADIDFSQYPKNPNFRNYIGACIPVIGIVVGANSLVNLFDGFRTVQKRQLLADIDKEFKASTDRMQIAPNISIDRCVYFNLRRQMAERELDNISNNEITGKKEKFFALNIGVASVSLFMTTIWLQIAQNYFKNK